MSQRKERGGVLLPLCNLSLQPSNTLLPSVSATNADASHFPILQDCIIYKPYYPYPINAVTLKPPLLHIALFIHRCFKMGTGQTLVLHTNGICFTTNVFHWSPIHLLTFQVNSVTHILIKFQDDVQRSDFDLFPQRAVWTLWFCLLYFWI